MQKKIQVVVVMLLILLSTNVLAITGTIENSRTVINAPVEKEVSRNIIVKNVNEYPVMILLSGSGPLSRNLIVEQNIFQLQPQESREVNYKISADEVGTTETKILVQFSGQSQSIGLFSTVIFNAREKIGPPLCTTASTCRVLCRADLTSTTRNCNSDYQEEVLTCNTFAKTQKEICRSSEGSSTNCIRETNVQLRICKKTALNTKNLCKSEAKEYYNSCVSQFNS